jgi:hypothetical protein
MKYATVPSHGLKGARCEIFQSLGFHNFLHYESLWGWGGDFVVKIKFKKIYLGVPLGPRNSLRICLV